MTSAPVRTRPATSTPVPAPIPFSRLFRVELRKMFDTRSGFWLMLSVAVVAVVATAAVIAFANRDDLTYSTFSTAIGVPLAIVLPIIAILSVTSEWSQRSGLTTFTLVPRRGRVIAAKAAVSLVVAVVSMLLALLIGALGNLIGSTIAGNPAVWDVTISTIGLIVLANIIGVGMGFMLGVLIRNSPGAIVGYFVYNMVLPPLLVLLAANQQWFHNVQPWIDLSYSSTRLYNGSPTAEGWAQLATSALIWLIIPLIYGCRRVLHAEVK